MPRQSEAWTAPPFRAAILPTALGAAAASSRIRSARSGSCRALLLAHQLVPHLIGLLIAEAADIQFGRRRHIWHGRALAAAVPQSPQMRCKFCDSRMLEKISDVQSLRIRGVDGSQPRN